MSPLSPVRIKKQAIYREAARLFREKGYPATSMRELASALGLEASSLYSHIRSKEELLDHICFITAEAFMVGMAQIESGTGSPLEQVKALIHLHIHIALGDPTSQTVFTEEWKHLSTKRLTRFLEMRRDYQRRFTCIIEAGQASGEIKKIHSDTILQTLISALRWLNSDKLKRNKEQLSLLENDIACILISGICT